MCREETGSKYRRRKGWKINDCSNARARARRSRGKRESRFVDAMQRAQGAMPSHRYRGVTGTRHTHIKLTIDERGYWLGQWDWNSVSGVYLSRISKVTRYRLTESSIYSLRRVIATYANDIEFNRVLLEAQSWARLSHTLALLVYPNRVSLYDK